MKKTLRGDANTARWL